MVKPRSYSEKIWSIDIWAYNRGDFEAAVQEHNALAAKLDKLNRLMLLRIKSAFDGQSCIVYKRYLSMVLKLTRVVAHQERCAENITMYLYGITRHLRGY